MGQSTDAYLFFGYIWDEETSLFEEEDDSQDALVERLAARTMADPWKDPSAADLDVCQPYEANRARGDAWTAAHRGELDAWYAHKRAIEKSLPCEIRSHCSYECRMPLVAVKSTFQCASRGFPVAAEMGDEDSAHRVTVEQFVQEHGIDVTDAQGPGWFLASMWC